MDYNTMTEQVTADIEKQVKEFNDDFWQGLTLRESFDMLNMYRLESLTEWTNLIEMKSELIALEAQMTITKKLIESGLMEVSQVEKFNKKYGREEEQNKEKGTEQPSAPESQPVQTDEEKSFGQKILQFVKQLLAYIKNSGMGLVRSIVELFSPNKIKHIKGHLNHKIKVSQSAAGTSHSQVNIVDNIKIKELVGALNSALSAQHEGKNIKVDLDTYKNLLGTTRETLSNTTNAQGGVIVKETYQSMLTVVEYIEEFLSNIGGVGFANFVKTAIKNADEAYAGIEVQNANQRAIASKLRGLAGTIENLNGVNHLLGDILSFIEIIIKKK